MGAPRLAPLTETHWDEELKTLFGTSARPPNILATLARHPKLLKRWLVFGRHVLAKNSLPARERELLILRTGFRCECDYEFHHHTAIGLASGLTQDEVQRTRGDLAGWTGDDAWLIRAADELVENKRLGDATWDALRARFDERQLIDIIFTVGQYVLVSMALNTLRVQIEDSE